MATCQSNRVVGYARVSTSDQNTSMQLRAFERAGVLEVHEEQMSAVKSARIGSAACWSEAWRHACGLQVGIVWLGR